MGIFFWGGGHENTHVRNAFSWGTMRWLAQDNKMHGDGAFVDTSGREWKGKFYNGQGPGLHTLPVQAESSQPQTEE